MKKVLSIIIAGVILIIVVFGVYFIVKKLVGSKTAEEMPRQISVELPSGEVVKAYRALRMNERVPSGTKIIATGRVIREKDDIGSLQLVLETELGAKYVLLNAPFLYKLEKDALGRNVKLKGITIEKTTLKNYPAIYIEDLEEIK